MRIEATEAAVETVRMVARERSELIMVLSNGCCDSTAPFLYDNYIAEPGAQPVGVIDGIPVVAPEWLIKLYPDDEPLIVDVDLGLLDDSFSLETEHDRRFVLRAPPLEPRP